ncbi:hypothetical protein TREMEDRAFT_63555 [Tremella mesenterica DSM 1558]|uniref:uncharacterized protein n=1 Tax=Tremella mesenterica (strain ATCC 24925 / CBS 8224 / DSM 1558 / NBRC 9311 / NRRL Y-6157 / RJB 2259-6 / UBC 559-6) TaxID=578456 RepID=UPI0003F4A224|nr:uncharacterized protein TREMEDRAFT_63555 [Tremella mesenterica DSM 1558]EIW68386.1 hypothetical protein TREMEDRAFT_63555 [Tremella mesenterica DSM 1558]
MLLQKSWVLLALAGLDLVLGAVLRKSSRSSMSNAERFKRGLPPKAPQRLYNSTETRPAMARRSATSGSGYIQVTPVGLTTVKRAGTVFDSVSYLYFVPAAGSFYLYITAAYSGLAIGICSQFFRGGSFNMEPGNNVCTDFTACSSTDATETPSSAAGQQHQAPIWSVPSSVPGSLQPWYFNADGTITTNANLYAFTSGSFSGALGMALDPSYFQASEIVQVEAELILSLPS